jgi:hypothetical protein
MRTIDPSLLRSAFYDETKAAWRLLRKRYPSEDFYAFGLFTTELASYLTITASTEQGLTRSAAEYAARASKSAADYLIPLRWSPADSPLRDGDKLLSRCQAIRDLGPDPYDCTEEENETSIHTVFTAFTDAARQLDKEGEFGTGPARERLIIGIWWGDQSDEERLALASPLNSHASVRRFGREMAAAYGNA